MKWIVITLPHFIEHEAEYINRLFEAGIDLLHLRKPDSDQADCERLLEEIPSKWYPQIVVHDHFTLCEKYHLHGIHLNRRHHEIPEGFQGSVSRSCHSIQEAREAISETNSNKTSETTLYKYVFLSPIFDSISKQGYEHAFTDEALSKAAEDGIINEKVIALGGITSHHIPQLRAWCFGGAAFLGDVWKRRNESQWTDYLAEIRLKLSEQSHTE